MNWLKVKKPKDIHQQFAGRTMTVYPSWEDARARTNPVRARVEHICGNFTHQTAFQINGRYLVSMLDAFAELNREELPDQDTHLAFCDTVSTRVERAPSNEVDEARLHAAQELPQ